MFEIGFLCPKIVNEMKKEELVQKKPVLELKEMDSKQLIFKMGLFTSIFFFFFFFLIFSSVFKGLLILTMFSIKSCL